MAITPDGRRAVSAFEDKTLEVWDLEAGPEKTGIDLRTLEGHSDGVNGVAITPDGRMAVSASEDKTLKVWDLESGEPIATFTCDTRALCCAIADNWTIVAGDQRGRVHLFALEFPQPRY